MKIDFSEAVKRYGDTVYKIAYVHSGSLADSEDIFQDTFFALYKADKDFSDEEHLKAWLIRVALNKSKMLKRSAWFRKRTDLDNNEATANHDTDTEALVCSAVMKLKESYRTVILLFYYEGYSCEEIAKILSTNSSTVRTRLSRARALLKNDLKEIWKDE